MAVCFSLSLWLALTTASTCNKWDNGELFGICSTVELQPELGFFSAFVLEQLVLCNLLGDSPNKFCWLSLNKNSLMSSSSYSANYMCISLTKFQQEKSTFSVKNSWSGGLFSRSCIVREEVNSLPSWSDYSSQVRDFPEVPALQCVPTEQGSFPLLLTESRRLSHCITADLRKISWTSCNGFGAWSCRLLSSWCPEHSSGQVLKSVLQQIS